MCYLTCPAQKYITSVRFFTWFLNLGKTQDSSQDADQVCWRHRLSAAPPHIKFTSFCRESQRLCTDGKIVKISRGRFHQPSLLLYYGGGMTLRVRPTVNSLDYGFKILFRSSLKSYCDFHEAGSGYFTWVSRDCQYYTRTFSIHYYTIWIPMNLFQ